MPAPEGNKNAEKWTLDKTRELVKKAFESIDQSCYFISSVAEKCETYRELFEYLLKKFNDDDFVFSTIKRIYNKCESIVAEKTAKGDITPALGIFILKSYHGLIETSKLNTEHSGKVDTGFTVTVINSSAPIATGEQEVESK